MRTVTCTKLVAELTTCDPASELNSFSVLSRVTSSELHLCRTTQFGVSPENPAHPPERKQRISPGPLLFKTSTCLVALYTSDSFSPQMTIPTPRISEVLKKPLTPGAADLQLCALLQPLFRLLPHKLRIVLVQDNFVEELECLAQAFKTWSPSKVCCRKHSATLLLGAWHAAAVQSADGLFQRPNVAFDHVR